MTMQKENTTSKPIQSAHAGVSAETIAWTQRLYELGKITREEKIRLDNEAIRAANLSQLNGIDTTAEEMPGDWEEFQKNRAPKSLESPHSQCP